MPAVLAFRNRQRARPLCLPVIRRITRQMLVKAMGVRDCELGFHFVDAAEMARVNQTYLQHEGSTDVITFDHNDETNGANPSRLHGEIFISVPDAVTQARAFSTTWTEELMRDIIHGLLHLRGYDDLQPALRRVMKREEERFLALATAQFNLREIGRPTLRSRRRSSS